MLRLYLLSLVLASASDAVWLKGNLHTHTLESDGDSSPAEVVRWYREHGYDFLVITDHDKVTKVDGGGLVMIPGEEVTDRLHGKSLHVNAVGLTRAIEPQRGKDVVDVMQRNIDAVRAAGGIAAINHPNFGWAFGAEEMLQLEGATLLEIASGHPYVNMQGPPSVEEMWDRLLTAGRKVWAIAVDDSHHFLRPWDTDMAPPGKAWVVVRSASREPKAIMSALASGDFHASTGVEIDSYAVTASAMTVGIRVKNQARYRTLFIGTGGVVLAESRENPATYRFRGNETYVRAKVIDSNDRKAWLQPWFPVKRP